MNPGLILFGALFCGGGIFVIARARSWSRAQSMLNNSPAMFIATGVFICALGVLTLLRGVTG